MDELLEFPFRAEVWGTASDWTMVVVTGLTLTYLVRTLKSQQAVQLLQSKSNFIQNELYRVANKPNFIFNLVKFKAVDDKETYFEVSITLNNNQANNFQTTLQCIGADVKSYKTTDLNILIFHPEHVTVLKFRTRSKLEGSGDWGASLHSRIDFEGPAGNCYFQECTIEYNAQSANLQQTLNTILEL